MSLKLGLFKRKEIPSPCYVLDEQQLEKNLKLLDTVQNEAGIDIILALKGFSMWSCFDLVNQYLKGATSSGVWEARLAREEINKDVHVFSPAYKQIDIDALTDLVDHLSFNSLEQWRRHKTQVAKAGVSIGLRINPENQEADTPLYDPCAPGSRLGILAKDLADIDMTGIDGFHCHNLCESDSYAAMRTLQAIDAKFGEYLPKLRWLNLGGGHLITREGYDVPHLISTLKQFKAIYPNLKIILEPGSAVAWDCGALVSEVVDIVENDDKIAILDISATAHMPDVLEMPYRPEVFGAGLPDEKEHTYKLGGNSCLAGDMIGEYSFGQTLKAGTRVIFGDMLHYTMVKTSFFNGVQHPSIGIVRRDGKFELVREFDYSDFKGRLS